MTMPVPYKPSKPLDPRLVTKTSLPGPKKAIASLVLLWYANEKPGRLEYGRSEGTNAEGGILDDETVSSISRLLEYRHIALRNGSVRDLLAGNALFSSQLEALNAAFELVWHLASFDFVSSNNRGNERTGGKRFRKVISFSANMDLIDAIVGDDLDALLEMLVSWLSDYPTSNNSSMEKRLTHALAVFSEVSFFKTGKGTTGDVYNPSGIYARLISGDQTVSTTDGDEAQGPTRILNSALQDGLNPYLSCKTHNVYLAPGVNIRDFDNYAKRAETSLRLSNIEIDAQQEKTPEKQSMAELNELPRNLIYFGAPGTGKSYQLNKLAQKSFSRDNIRRVTFYPDYTYSQFVGSFRPYTEDGEIGYGFTPGPFLQTYLDASLHPYESYLLIIEELNRANTAAVFGDAFQLLDRNPHGSSEYSVAVPKEMAICIGERLSEVSDTEKKDIETYFDPDLDFEDFCHSTVRDLTLPPNMYIWATMNSADQGVFPMDTAFKRRWDFHYMGINQDDCEPMDAYDGRSVNDFTVNIGDRPVRWNALRKAINGLMRRAGINEDKLLGPFFLSPSALSDDPATGDSGQSVFVSAFKDKVLLYLYEDAGKMRRDRIFAKDGATYSELCRLFDDRGVGVFDLKEDELEGVFADSASDDADGE